MDKKRWRNYGLWVSVFAFIALFLESLGYTFLPINYEELYKAFLGILILAGIVSNPETDNKLFGDDKHE